ncbi:hypothetical protein O181_015990 [Austropuccinia psidii MF-1]|uniref:Uncharacterized protein n=1 Tax=Austropuccinia psidii MF-1 TaxID=1389203 RepID=A0A9Q3GRH2_9BASI|nr:hypothetical protein [Austropuccinia psidii MF-1]
MLYIIVHHFSTAIQWWQYQMVISTFQHLITSSRHPIIQRNHQGSRASVSASKTNDAIKQSLVILTPSIPSNGILSIHSQKCIQEAVPKEVVKCQSSTQSILATIFISIQSGSTKDCISFSSMGSSFNPIQFQY